MTRNPSRLTSLLLLASMLLCLASVSLAQDAMPGPGEGPPPGEGRRRGPGPPPFEDLLERHAGRLGLDEATLAKVRAARDGSREEMQRLDEALRKLRGELRALLDKEAPDLAEVLAQADSAGAAETALHKRRLRTMLEIRALLTPEQRAELVRIHQEMRRERGKRHGPGGPSQGQGGPPPGRGSPDSGPPPVPEDL